MSVIWWVLTCVSIVAIIITNPSQALPVMINGANEATKLAMSLTATYALWLGFFEIVERIGVAKWLSKIVSPIIKFLFPSAGEQASELITLNVSANVLGLGNAATSIGVRAMSELENSLEQNNQKFQKESLSDDMITFLVLSATGLQILPTTMLGLRVSVGSQDPTCVLLPCVVATIVSALVGVFACKLIGWIKRKNKRVKIKNGEPVLYARG